MRRRCTRLSEHLHLIPQLSPAQIRLTLLEELTEEQEDELDAAITEITRIMRQYAPRDKVGPIHSSEPWTVPVIFFGDAPELDVAIAGWEV